MVLGIRGEENECSNGRGIRRSIGRYREFICGWTEGCKLRAIRAMKPTYKVPRTAGIRAKVCKGLDMTAIAAIRRRLHQDWVTLGGIKGDPDLHPTW